MLTAVTAAFNIGLLYFCSFFLGYLALDWAGPNGFAKLPFFVRLPSYLASGLLTFAVLLFVAGIFEISGYTLIFAAVCSLLIILYRHRYSLKFRHKNSKSDFTRRCLSSHNVVPAVLFTTTFLYYVIVIGIFGWPPPGDVFNHGMFTSTFVYNGKVVFTLTPHSSQVQLAPLLTVNGLHAISATLSVLTDLLPGEAVFAVGGAIVILIPLLLYSITYYLTRSRLMSLLSFLSTFLIGPGLERWVVGYFYNGPYPSLFGFLAILVFAICPIASSETRAKHVISKREGAFALAVIIGLLSVYPAFVVFPLLYIAAFKLYRVGRTRLLDFLRKKWKSMLVLSVLLLIVVVLFAVASIAGHELLQAITLRLSKVYARPGYAIYPPLFYTSAVGIAILVVGVACFFLLRKHLYFGLALFYLVVFIPAILSLHPYLFPVFSLLLPNRSLMICSLVSWTLIPVLLIHVFPDRSQGSADRTLKEHLKKIVVGRRRVAAALLIILFVFTPSLFSHFTFEPAYRYSWLNRHGLKNDYNVLLWIHESIQSNELIMNDYSYTSQYLPSFSIKNLTSKILLNSDNELSRAIAVQDFWKDPTDLDHFVELVENYSISYILVTSERGYSNWEGIGGDNKYTSKPYSASEYKKVLSDNPLVELLFEKGDAAVYSVSELRNATTFMQAVRLDGVDDFVSVEHSESLEPSTDVAISLWIKPLELPSEDTFIVSKRRYSDGYELSWRWNRRVAVIINDTIILQSNKVFDSNDLRKWWNIVAICDGSRVSIYINGKLDSSQNYTGEIAFNDASLSIGCRAPYRPMAFLPSLFLDEVCIYNRALSQDEVEFIYGGSNVTDGLVLYLNLEEGDGVTLIDQSDFANHGTIHGAIWIEYKVVYINSFMYRI